MRLLKIYQAHNKHRCAAWGFLRAFILKVYFCYAFVGTVGILQTYQAPLVCLQRPVISQPEEVCLNQDMFSEYLRLIKALPLTDGNFTKGARWNMGSGTDPTTTDGYMSMHERCRL